MRVGNVLVYISGYRHSTRSFRVRQKLMSLGFVEGLSSGVCGQGDYFTAYIRVGMEARAAEIPATIDGMPIHVRLGGLDTD